MPASLTSSTLQQLRYAVGPSIIWRALPLGCLCCRLAGSIGTSRARQVSQTLARGVTYRLRSRSPRRARHFLHRSTGRDSTCGRRRWRRWRRWRRRGRRRTGGLRLLRGRRGLRRRFRLARRRALGLRQLLAFVGSLAAGFGSIAGGSVIGGSGSTGSGVAAGGLLAGEADVGFDGDDAIMNVTSVTAAATATKRPIAASSTRLRSLGRSGT